VPEPKKALFCESAPADRRIDSGKRSPIAAAQPTAVQRLIELGPSAAGLDRYIEIASVDFDDAVEAARVDHDHIFMGRQIALGVGHAAAARHNGDAGSGTVSDNVRRLVGGARQRDGERRYAGLPEDVIRIKRAARLVGQDGIIAERASQCRNERLAALG
jgi:hypothetical protein